MLRKASHTLFESILVAFSFWFQVYGSMPWYHIDGLLWPWQPVSPINTYRMMYFLLIGSVTLDQGGLLSCVRLHIWQDQM